eukprot:1540830-Amphidinium_carterae.1
MQNCLRKHDLYHYYFDNSNKQLYELRTPFTDFSTTSTPRLHLGQHNYNEEKVHTRPIQGGAGSAYPILTITNFHNVTADVQQLSNELQCEQLRP